MMRVKLLIFALLFSVLGWGQTFYNMSSGNYQQDFADMTNWTNNYAAGIGANNWRVATSVATSTVNTANVFVTTTTGGIQKGTTQTIPLQNLVILATGTNSSATDLLLNFTNRTAGTISLDWAKITNTVSATPRTSDLKIQYSIDNGVTFNDLTGYTIPRINNNVTVESGTLSSISLPSALNNQSQVVLRFYSWNNGQTGGSGNRPKFSIDNVNVTSTAISAPEINIQGNSTTIADGDTTPSTLEDTDFGTTTVLTNVVKTYTIQNTGTADLNVSTITMTTGAKYTVGGISLPAVIAAGGSTTFTVTFNSATTGTFTDTVLVSNNDTDEATYNYDVTALIPAPAAPEINIQGNLTTIVDGDNTPSTLDDTDFGTVATSTNVVKTYTIQNTGTSNLNVSAITMSSGTEYAVGGISLPAIIAAGGSTTFTVTFNSVAAGTFTDTVNVASDDTDEATYNYDVHGVAVVAPVITSTLSASGTQGNAFNYTITAANSPTSFSATGLPTGLSINTTTGVISGTPTVTGTFNVTIGASNIAGSDSQTLVITITVACYIASFDGVVKTSYVEDIVTIAGSEWILGETLIGNSGSDYFVGTDSARMRANANAVIELNNQLTTGLSTVDFTYRRYGTDAIVAIFSVDISKDNGNSWIEIGTIAPSATIQTFSATVNQSGNVKFRIKYKSGTTSTTHRVNIDNIQLCPYSTASEIEVFGNSTTVLDGSTTTKLLNNTNFGDTYFVGDPAIVKTFTVTNYGSGTLTLSNPTLSGSADFSVGVLSSTSLAAGASATFTVSFSSSSTGLKSASINIVNDDSDENPFDFVVSCYSNNYIKCSLMPLSTIAYQDYEGAGTLIGTSTGGTFATAGGQNYADNRTTTTNMFIGTNSYQVTGATTHTLEFNNVDTSTYKNTQFSFRLGAYATSSAQGMETADKVLVSISEDGGTTWSEQFILTGNNNAISDINTSTGTAVSVTYDNTLVAGKRYGMAIGSTNTFANSFTITGLPSVSQLKIKFTFNFSSSGGTAEIWALDNLNLQGQLPQSTTWNGSTWSAGVPTTSTKAIFDGSYSTATGNVEACECQINATGSLTVNSNNYIEVQSNITNNGIFNVLNNGSLVQVDDTAVNTGAINLERTAFVDYRDYVYWSSPVANFNSANISSYSSNNNLYKWIPTVSGNGVGDFGNWTNGTETMVLGKGYIERGLNNAPLNSPVNFTSTFIGVPNNGSISTPISRGTYNTVGTYTSPYSPTNATQDDDNWNLLGNPYPSAISADSFLTANSSNLDGFVKIWLHGIAPSASALDPFYNNYGYNYDPNDYLTYNLSGPSTPGVFDGYIGAGQGFITRMSATSASTSANAVFNNSMRSKTYRNDQFYKFSNSTSKGRVWIDLVSSTASSSTLIAYVDGATNGKDLMYDAQANLKANFSIYSLLEGFDRHVIQGRSLPFDQNDQVPLAIKIPSNGNYTIAIKDVDGFFNNSNQPIYLEDKQTNFVHDLRLSPYYFTSTSGEFVQRFVLRYTNQTLGNDQFEVSDNSVRIYASDNSIVINSNIEPIKAYEIYNVLGQTLISKKQLKVNKTEETSLQKGSQALIVKVILENGKTITKKVMY